MHPSASLSSGLDAALAAIVGRRMSIAPADRLAYSRDAWPRTLLALRDGESAPYPPDVVVWPERTSEVAELVKLASKRKIPLVAYGGGSSVVGSAAPVQGGIVLDLKRMNRVLSIDAESLEATFEAGILGEHLEHELALAGLTLGHFPSSIHISTLGGWLATRSAGQLSTKYGKIEDMARALEVVLGTGEIVELDPGGHLHGIDWRPIFIGSEGTLGVITKARVRVHPAPAVRLLRGFAFPDLPRGVDAVRTVLQQGLRPSIVRLYDTAETFLHRLSQKKPGQAPTAAPPDERGHTLSAARSLLLRTALGQPGVLNRVALGLGRHFIGHFLPRLESDCLLVVGVEGDAQRTPIEAQRTFALLGRQGGRDLGEAPGVAWLANRYKVSFEQSKIFEQGAFVDTMEVATTWDRLLDLYQAIRRALEPFALVMAHLSHAYAEGCSLYFTFIGTGRHRADAERRYDLAWQRALRATLETGGVLSHHHGIGLAKQRYMLEEHGAAMQLFRALKRVLDPAGILNPGKLGLA